jgi:putative ATPase
MPALRQNTCLIVELPSKFYSMAAPLAERMRPNTLSDYIGQQHLVGPGSVLAKIISTGSVPSFILWGPPGVGKTTLANIVAQELGRPFFALSAINSGVKDIRDTIDKASQANLFQRTAPILFIDEIHRFSKSQQDSLLGAVEKGIVTLIGATTENPSFEVIPALLSRCQVYVLQHLSKEDLISMVTKALTTDKVLAEKKLRVASYNAMLRLSGGDGRKLYNILELVAGNAETGDELDDEKVQAVVHQNLSIYDKEGEMHYDLISAFIKSVRGSSADAAIYYMARMIEGGEDPLFLCRRMIILAAEDIGLANPNALLIANACFQAVHNIGMPEGRIIMSQTAIYLACSPKSNSAYLAIDSALEEVRKNGNVPIPLHLRNAPTSLMKELGYGKDYQYAHDFKDNFVNTSYLPEELGNIEFYKPGENAAEEKYRLLLARFTKK